MRIRLIRIIRGVLSSELFSAIISDIVEIVSNHTSGSDFCTPFEEKIAPRLHAMRMLHSLATIINPQHSNLIKGSIQG